MITKENIEELLAVLKFTKDLSALFGDGISLLAVHLRWM